jgi:hypothetical protein
MAGFGPAVVASIPLLPPHEGGPSPSFFCAFETAGTPFLPDTDMIREHFAAKWNHLASAKMFSFKALERPLRVRWTRGAPVSSGIRKSVCKGDRWSW